MKIVIVSQHLCVRGSQMGLAAKRFGHEVHLALHPESMGRQFNEKFDSLQVWHSKEQLADAIKRVQPDIIHVQDRPHLLTVEVIELGLGIPIIQDVHDMDSMLDMPMGHPLAEAKSLLRSDGLVFVSQPCLDYAERWLGPLPPAVVVPSATCHSFMPTQRLPHVGGAVWQGGLYPEPPNSPRRYIDQIDIVRSFRNQDQAVFLHPAPNGYPDNIRPYAAEGAIVGPPMAYLPLLKTLTRYDFGWYGQTTNAEQIHKTLPNKLFDYIAAGLPVLVIRANEAAKFVTEHGVGLAIDSPDQFGTVKDELLKLRPEVWKKRHELTRERVIHPLLQLYERLAGKTGAKETTDEKGNLELRNGGDGEPIAVPERAVGGYEVHNPVAD